MVNVTYTLYTQDNNGNTYITGDGVNNMYKFNINTLSFVSLNPTNNGPKILAEFLTYHLLNDKEIIVSIGYNLTQVLLQFNYCYCYYCYYLLLLLIIIVI